MGKLPRSQRIALLVGLLALTGAGSALYLVHRAETRQAKAHDRELVQVVALRLAEAQEQAHLRLGSYTSEVALLARIDPALEGEQLKRKLTLTGDSQRYRVAAYGRYESDSWFAVERQPDGRRLYRCHAPADNPDCRGNTWRP